MKVSLVVRMGVGKRRRYVKFNKKRVYPDGTVFCLRYGRKFETLQVSHQGAALRRRAEKEAELVKTPLVSADATVAQRIFLKDAAEKYLSDVSVARKWRRYLTYKKALTDFQSSCSKQYLDELTKDVSIHPVLTRCRATRWDVMRLPATTETLRP